MRALPEDGATIAAELREAAAAVDVLTHPALARMLREYALTIESSQPWRTQPFDKASGQAWALLMWSAGGLLRIAQEVARHAEA